MVMTWRWFPVVKSKWCHLPRSRSTSSVFNAEVALRWKKVLIEWEQTHWVRTNRQWQWWLERFLGLWLHHHGEALVCQFVWHLKDMFALSVAPSSPSCPQFWKSWPLLLGFILKPMAYLCLLRPTSLSQVSPGIPNPLLDTMGFPMKMSILSWQPLHLSKWMWATSPWLPQIASNSHKTPTTIGEVSFGGGLFHDKTPLISQGNGWSFITFDSHCIYILYNIPLVLTWFCDWSPPLYIYISCGCTMSKWPKIAFNCKCSSIGSGQQAATKF